MKALLVPLPLAALFLLSACESLTGVAPKGTPRVEVELAVQLAPGFRNPLVDADGELIAAMKEVVRDKADIGLRFYPIPSEEYAAGNERPPYLLVVELSSFTLTIESEETKGSGEPAPIVQRVDKVGCSVKTSFRRRRPEAPALWIGSSEASLALRANRDPDEIARGQGYATSTRIDAPRVLRADILRALDLAVERALKSLRTSIDREFAQLGSAADDSIAAP